LIPRNIQFIDGSVFWGVKLSSILTESRNEGFAVGNDFSIGIVYDTLICDFSNSPNSIVPASPRVLDDSWKPPLAKESDSTVWHRDPLLDVVAIGINTVS
jgi:hypothetical protein